ncbi:hypothetical protein K435DRAFT_846130 [Dendrothele bispora CBS 962.96]|uniref:Uncharacterized protein n=1 Tax=Dendrothele bispora (strain CBS 962.96) TaxID=1314807 RepID=A0A4S8KPV2_DENBC|nr:hypothetical protein K435DRAFT_846130 [Dendrothele bispora CBS 962.96]
MEETLAVGMTIDVITTSSPTLVIVTTVIATTGPDGSLFTLTTTTDVTSFVPITSTSALPVKHVSDVAPRKPTPIGIIAGSVIGSVVLVILIFIGVIFYRKRLLKKGSHIDNTKSVRDQIVYPYDLKHESARFHSMSLNQRTIPSLNGLDAKHQPAEVNDPQDVGSLATAHTRNHSETRPISGSSVRYSESLHDSARDQSVIGSTSTATVRQMQLQEEADDLRQQVRQLQQTVDTSNDDMQGMQVAMRRMMEHILSLESQLNSDWARGLTDEPPPMYGEQQLTEMIYLKRTTALRLDTIQANLSIWATTSLSFSFDKTDSSLRLKVQVHMSMPINDDEGQQPTDSMPQFCCKEHFTDESRYIGIIVFMRNGMVLTEQCHMILVEVRMKEETRNGTTKAAFNLSVTIAP